MDSFEYYEIKAAVDDGESTQSFYGRPEWCEMRGGEIYTAAGAMREAMAYAETVEGGATPFWTLYGRRMESGCMVADAIGDFDTFESALDCLNRILAPLAAARDAFESLPYTGPVRPLHDMAATLADIINQSTCEERL